MKRVLITGASGNLGRKLCQHLQDRGGFSLTMIDARSVDETEVVVADLSTYDPGWTESFAQQDAVVHLAADPRPEAPWTSLQKHNVDATLNVFAAALMHGVKRLVFTSSCQVMLGHPAPRSLSCEAAPSPVNFYGATKVFGERLAKSYAESHGLSAVCLRIGTIRRGPNPPDVGSYRGQRQWLSNRDFCQAVEKAIITPDIDFAILFVTSENAMPLWDLSETCRILGFQPADRHCPRPPSVVTRLRHRMRKTLARR